MDLMLGLLDVRHMMEYAVAEYHVKAVIGERQGQNAALLQLVVSEIPQHEPGSDSLDGLGGQVNPGPAGAVADQALRVSPLPQPDLEELLTCHVEGVDAFRQVPLVLVPEIVVIREEF